MGPREHVWVGIRVRPLLEAERGRREETRWTTSGSTLLQPLPPSTEAPTYSFDQVFPTSTSAEEIYCGVAKDRVHSALQVCFYALTY